MKRIILFIVFALMLVGCRQANVGVGEQTANEQEETIVKAECKVIQRTNIHIRKIVLDGHEYFVFTNKVANPPYVIHSEGCPCHNN